MQSCKAPTLHEVIGRSSPYATSCFFRSGMRAQDVKLHNQLQAAFSLLRHFPQGEIVKRRRRIAGDLRADGSGDTPAEVDPQADAAASRGFQVPCVPSATVAAQRAERSGAQHDGAKADEQALANQVAPIEARIDRD